MRSITTGCLVALWLLGGVGCKDYAADCELNGECLPGPGAGGSSSGTGGSGGDGGQGGSAGSTPTECVPSEASDAVGSDCGIFVSSSPGDDDNLGGLDKPVATIKRALEIAGSKPIYVCS